jgi:D-aspartate ligase
MESIATESLVPAVVVRGEVNGLGVVRSLAQGGVPTAVVDTTLRHAAMWSRFSRRHVIRQLTGRPFVEVLLALQKELAARPVLILTDEMSVHSVSECRNELSPNYRFRLPSPAMVATLCNKALFQHFAEQHELPVPRAIILEGESAPSAKFPISGYRLSSSRPISGPFTWVRWNASIGSTSSKMPPPLAGGC